MHDEDGKPFPENELLKEQDLNFISEARKMLTKVIALLYLLVLIMKELQDIINDLQARLAIVGGGRIIITSDHVSISLGKEHEYFEVQENALITMEMISMKI